MQPRVKVVETMRLRDEHDEPLTLTVCQCLSCDRSFEFAFGDYVRCPHCGALLKEDA